MMSDEYKHEILTHLFEMFIGSKKFRYINDFFKDVACYDFTDGSLTVSFIVNERKEFCSVRFYNIKKVLHEHGDNGNWISCRVKLDEVVSYLPDNIRAYLLYNLDIFIGS